MLEQYSAALKNAEAAGASVLTVQERELRNSLDKVIMIFKSDMFDALLGLLHSFNLFLLMKNFMLQFYLFTTILKFLDIQDLLIIFY